MLIYISVRINTRNYCRKGMVLLMYRLVIFDLDGTLVNSLEDLAESCNQALAYYGYPVHETEKYRYFVGNGVVKLVERTLPENARDEANVRKVKERFDMIYKEMYNCRTRAYEGIDSLLDSLHENHILTAVASNKPDEFTQVIVRELFGDAFSLVSGKRDGFEKKPDPQIALHIMQSLGVSPEETLFAGDSAVDMQTAANAGCHSIGCTWGFRTREELVSNNADYIADKPADILSAAMGGSY